MKYFFEEIKALKNFENKLGIAGLEPHEKEEIIGVAKSATHHKVMDFIFSELKNEEGFMELFSEELDYGIDLPKVRKQIKSFEKKVEEIIKESEEDLLRILD